VGLGAPTYGPVAHHSPTPKVAEVGHQKLLLEDYAAAASQFEAAQQLDPLCASAALGLAEACILEGRLEEGEQQLQVHGIRGPRGRKSLSAPCTGASRTSRSSPSYMNNTHALTSVVVLCTRPPPQLLPDLLAAHTHLGEPPNKARSGNGTATASSPAPLVLATAPGGDSGAAAGGDAGEGPAVLLYLRGLLAWARGRQSEGLLLLERSVQRLLTEVEEAPLGLPLFGDLEVARVLAVVRRLLATVGPDPRQPGEAPASALAKSVRCERCGGPLPCIILPSHTGDTRMGKPCD
jgi:hypothetical protein